MPSQKVEAKTFAISVHLVICRAEGSHNHHHSHIYEIAQDILQGCSKQINERDQRFKTMPLLSLESAQISTYYSRQLADCKEPRVECFEFP